MPEPMPPLSPHLQAAAVTLQITAWLGSLAVVAATLTPAPVERRRLRLELPTPAAADRLAVLALAGEIGGRGAP